MTPAIAEPRAVTDALLNMPAHHGKSDTEKTPNPAKDVFKSYMEAGAPPVDSYTYLPGAMATDYERQILKRRAYEDVGDRIMACEDIVELRSKVISSA